MAKNAKPKPTKINAVEIPSDDCTVTTGGVEYRPHVGESVWVIPGLTVREVGLMKSMKSVEAQMATVEGDDDQAEQQVVIISGNLEEVIGLLKRRVVKWDWTDDAGAKHPQPTDDPDVFTDLQTHEIYYLASVVMGEAPGAEKNA